MDLERAMEFMLEQQARFQEQQAQMQAQQAKFQAGLGEHDKRLAKAERLLVRGAETLAIHREAMKNHREAMKDTDERITALVLAHQGNDQRFAELHASQLATEQGLREVQSSLKAFLDSMSKGGNGH